MTPADERLAGDEARAAPRVGRLGGAVRDDVPALVRPAEPQPPRRHEISSHNINAFGDVSFVEAAVFLVAAGVIAMLFARAEGREFHLPGGDGTIVMVAGGWAALLIFYRVFSRPAGNGYPVGIEWGFFLAFVAAGALVYAGWRMRAVERPEPPASAARDPRRPCGPPGTRSRAPVTAEVRTVMPPAAALRATAAPSPLRPRRAAGSARAARRFPPVLQPTEHREAEQLSFEDRRRDPRE